MKKFRFLIAIVVILATILSACGTTQTAQVIEKEVIKTVEVEVKVVETRDVEKVVEKVVVATPQRLSFGLPKM